MGYFLDTYAIIEYLQGNKRFYPYLKEENLLTSVFNLTELYYRLLSLGGERYADEKSLPFVSISASPKPLTIKSAMKFRLANKGRNLSYADCIGYQLAKERGLIFLTGDKDFKDLPDVEFVK